MSKVFKYLSMQIKYNINQIYKPNNIKPLVDPLVDSLHKCTVQ